MANNYSQGTVSPYLPLTQAHKDLLDWQADDSVLDSDGEWLDDMNQSDPVCQERAELDRLAASLGMYYEFYCSLGYESYGRDSHLSYIYAENGLDEAGAQVLQHILKGLDPVEYPHIQAEGCFSCSKLRQGEFGGWACHITREDIQSSGTGEWLYRQTLPATDKTSHWDNDPEFPVEDWQLDIANGDTRSGYRDWCSMKRAHVSDYSAP